MDNFPIKLKSKEGEIIEFDRRLIDLSVYVKSCPNYEDVIPLDIPAETLKFILKFM
jgi:hypothetical protein